MNHVRPVNSNGVAGVSGWCHNSPGGSDFVALYSTGNYSCAKKNMIEIL